MAKSFDLDTKTFINKHDIVDGVLQRNAEMDKEDASYYSDIENKKEAYNTTKKELMGKAMATGNFDQVGYNAAYNLGINEKVAEKAVSIAADIKMDLFASDSEIVNYYTNYDSNQAKIEQEVASGYGAAYERELKLQQEHDAIEKAYENKYLNDTIKANAEKQEALNAITNLASRFANLSDFTVGEPKTGAEDDFNLDI